MRLALVLHIVDLNHTAICYCCGNRRGVCLFKLVALVLVRRVHAGRIYGNLVAAYPYLLLYYFCVGLNLHIVLVVLYRVAQLVRLALVLHIEHFNNVFALISADNRIRRCDGRKLIANRLIYFYIIRNT